MDSPLNPCNCYLVVNPWNPWEMLGGATNHPLETSSPWAKFPLWLMERCTLSPDIGEVVRLLAEKHGVFGESGYQWKMRMMRMRRRMMMRMRMMRRMRRPSPLSSLSSNSGCVSLRTCPQTIPADSEKKDFRRIFATKKSRHHGFF